MKLPAGSGVLLQDVKANCQGSSCTTAGQVSTGNQVGNGIITDNSDGVWSVWSSAFICHPLRNHWSLNVTKEMQTQRIVTGNIVVSGVAGNSSLTITSTPPRALPIAQHFDPSADQWKAYTTGEFLTAYIAENQLTSLQALFVQASSEFLPTTVAEGLICNPDAGNLYSCTPPSSLLDCDASSQNSTKGFLVVRLIVRVSQVLALLYQTLADCQGDLVGLKRRLISSPVTTRKHTIIPTLLKVILTMPFLLSS